MMASAASTGRRTSHAAAARAAICAIDRALAENRFALMVASGFLLLFRLCVFEVAPLTDEGCKALPSPYPEFPLLEPLAGNAVCSTGGRKLAEAGSHQPR